jgi:hypothetical protein
MTWNKQFQRATIEQKGNVFVLEITYWWYWATSYKETFICNTLQDAKDLLLKERTRDHLDIKSG